MTNGASRLKTAIVYTPSIIPASASVDGQLAYIEGTLLPGPTVDPEGWQTLPKVMVYGELLGRRKVEVGCTLSFAKPVIIVPFVLWLKWLTHPFLALLYPWRRLPLLPDSGKLKLPCPRSPLNAKVSLCSPYAAGTLQPRRVCNRQQKVKRVLQVHPMATLMCPMRDFRLPLGLEVETSGWSMVVDQGRR